MVSPAPRWRGRAGGASATGCAEPLMPWPARHPAAYSQPSNAAPLFPRRSASTACSAWPAGHNQTMRMRLPGRADACQENKKQHLCSPAWPASHKQTRRVRLRRRADARHQTKKQHLCCPAGQGRRVGGKKSTFGEIGRSELVPLICPTPFGIGTNAMNPSRRSREQEDGKRGSIPRAGLPDRCNSVRLVLHFRLNQDTGYGAPSADRDAQGPGYSSAPTAPHRGDV